MKGLPDAPHKALGMPLEPAGRPFGVQATQTTPEQPQLACIDSEIRNYGNS
jgi:hypothetical protein